MATVLERFRSKGQDTAVAAEDHYRSRKVRAMANEAGQGIGVDGGLPHRQSRQAFGVLCLLAAMLIVPAALTLSRVEHPGIVNNRFGQPDALRLHLEPAVHCAGGRAGQLDCSPGGAALPAPGFWRTLAVLVPMGFVLDLAFGSAFFVFPNGLLGNVMSGLGEEKH